MLLALPWFTYPFTVIDRHFGQCICFSKYEDIVVFMWRECCGAKDVLQSSGMFDGKAGNFFAFRIPPPRTPRSLGAAQTRAQSYAELCQSQR